VGGSWLVAGTGFAGAVGVAGGFWMAVRRVAPEDEREMLDEVDLN